MRGALIILYCYVTRDEDVLLFSEVSLLLISDSEVSKDLNSSRDSGCLTSSGQSKIDLVLRYHFTLDQKIEDKASRDKQNTLNSITVQLIILSSGWYKR